MISVDNKVTAVKRVASQDASVDSEAAVKGAVDLVDMVGARMAAAAAVIARDPAPFRAVKRALANREMTNKD
jgi:hypothetical protein